MTRILGRNAVWGLWLCAAAAGYVEVAPAHATEVRRVTERVFAFEPGGKIHVQNRNGRLTVEAWSKPEVRVQITRSVRAGDAKKAEELLKDLKAEIEIRGDRLEIVSRFPKRQESYGLWEILGQKVASLQIHYYLQVPRDVNLALETTNGAVRVRGARGRISCTTTNGEVDVAQLEGEVQLVTTNGEIRLRSVAGAANARTTNGSVLAELRSVDPEGDVELATTNGNVEIYFPDELKATLEATTTNGRVAVSFPLTTEGVMTSKSVRGKINGGGATVSLTTTNGNIDVRRLGERRSGR